MWAKIILVLLISMICDQARSQDHNGHPPQDQAIHKRFYSTWMMPRDRQRSCCNEADCSPAESRLDSGGHWEARKVEDKDADFTKVPEEDVEHQRDSPDGRSHLCGWRARGLIVTEGSYHVLCFIPGAGT